jgi:hypothetical protein
MRAALRAFALITVFVLASLPRSALAQPAPPPDQQQPAYAPGELANAGQRFFGTVSRDLATVIENAVSTWGLPNGYVLGEEAGGAFFGGLRYGEGVLYTKNAGDLKVFWQGPTLGWDFGGGGARTMMLVYLAFTPRFVCYTLSILFTVTLVLIILAVPSAVYVLAVPLAVFAGLTILGTRDLVQTRHSVLRSY